MAGTLDHIVINVRYEMDKAAEQLAALGFCLTPRGHHSLGSTNHLMMFDQDYLEILGVPEGNVDARPDLFTSPFGLNSIVFKTGDADAAFSRFEALGMAGDPPRAFSRPVDLEDGSRPEARFRTVTARADAFPAGRLYFCEHQTPDLLWRPEWMTHPGAITGFKDYFVVTPTPAEDAALIGKLLELPVENEGETVSTVSFKCGFNFVFLTADAYKARFGASARIAKDRDVYFGALGLKCASPDDIAERAAGLEGVKTQVHDGALHVTLEDLDTLLVFSR